MENNKDDNKIDDIYEDNEENGEIEEYGTVEVDNPETVKIKKKGKWIGLAVKATLVIAILALVFYLIYFTAGSGKARFALSKNEISSITEEISNQELNFSLNEKIYFYIAGKEKNNIQADLIIVEIQYFKDDSYKTYKKISYEVSKDFPKLHAYIPGEYFAREGKYKIRAHLDGNIMAEKEIMIGN